MDSAQFHIFSYIFFVQGNTVVGLFIWWGIGTILYMKTLILILVLAFSGPLIAQDCGPGDSGGSDGGAGDGGEGSGSGSGGAGDAGGDSGGDGGTGGEGGDSNGGGNSAGSGVGGGNNPGEMMPLN